MARFDRFPNKAAAWQAIAGWGNEIVQGTPFTDVAQAHSQDVSAADGGVHTWTTKGSLASKVIDEAIFSLPVGQLSQILEDSRGFHIIRVLEQHDLEVTPFTEKQAEIVKKIREERINDKRNEYKAKLREESPSGTSSKKPTRRWSKPKPCRPIEKGEWRNDHALIPPSLPWSQALAWISTQVLRPNRNSPAPGCVFASSLCRTAGPRRQNRPLRPGASRLPACGKLELVGVPCRVSWECRRCGIAGC